MAQKHYSKKVLIYVVPILSVNPSLLTGAFKDEQREHIWRTCYDYAASYIDDCIPSDQLDPIIEASNMVLGVHDPYSIIDALDQNPDLLYSDPNSSAHESMDTFIRSNIHHYVLFDIIL